MTDEELDAILAYARNYEDRALPPCVHGREPIDRCDQCDGSTIENLVAEVRRLRDADADRELFYSRIQRALALLRSLGAWPPEWHALVRILDGTEDERGTVK